MLAEAAQGFRMNRAELAKRSGFSRSAFYKHVKQEDLPDHILFRYGKTMGRDFNEDLQRNDHNEMGEAKSVEDTTLTKAVKKLDDLAKEFERMLEREETKMALYNSQLRKLEALLKKYGG